MGQGCSSSCSSLGGRWSSSSGSFAYAESPDRVMREIMKTSVASATIRDGLRNKPTHNNTNNNNNTERKKRSGLQTEDEHEHQHEHQHETIAKDTIHNETGAAAADPAANDEVTNAMKKVNGQEHLLFHNLVFQKKKQQQQQQKAQPQSLLPTTTSASNGTSSSGNIGGSGTTKLRGRGRKIAESFEVERKNNTTTSTTTTTEGRPSFSKEGGTKTTTTTTNNTTTTTTNSSSREQHRNSSPGDRSKHTGSTSCPTRLWIRRRPSVSRCKSILLKRRNNKPKHNRNRKSTKQHQQRRSSSTPEVVLLEPGKSYQKDRDYFGVATTATATKTKTKKQHGKTNAILGIGNKSKTSIHIYAMRHSSDDNNTSTKKTTESQPQQQQQEHRNGRVPGSVPIASTSTTTSSTTSSSSSSIRNTTTAAAAASGCPSSWNDERDPPSEVCIFGPATMALPPKRDVASWTTVSEEHDIYVVDLGLSPTECDDLVTTTEQVCSGEYAAYTYAKQTLGCKDYPLLALAAQGPVHSMVGAITDAFGGRGPDPNGNSKAKASHLVVSSLAGNANANRGGDASDAPPQPPPQNTTAATAQSALPTKQRKNRTVLQLDDKEPHIVKYDVTKKERQKLDMHTDKSEWTFLIALSNGCGLDYEGGGTYFECLDATCHVQKGHALVFPGKLRHKGQAIHHGLRFLLVGFLVDKGALSVVVPATTATGTTPTIPAKSTVAAASTAPMSSAPRAADSSIPSKGTAASASIVVVTTCTGGTPRTDAALSCSDTPFSDRTEVVLPPTAIAV